MFFEYKELFENKPDIIDEIQKQSKETTKDEIKEAMESINKRLFSEHPINTAIHIFAIHETLHSFSMQNDILFIKNWMQIGDLFRDFAFWVEKIDCSIDIQLIKEKSESSFIELEYSFFSNDELIKEGGFIQIAIKVFKKLISSHFSYYAFFTGKDNLQKEICFLNACAIYKLGMCYHFEKDYSNMILAYNNFDEITKDVENNELYKFRCEFVISLTKLFFKTNQTDFLFIRICLEHLIEFYQINDPRIDVLLKKVERKKALSQKQIGFSFKKTCLSDSLINTKQGTKRIKESINAITKKDPFILYKIENDLILHLEDSSMSNSFQRDDVWLSFLEESNKKIFINASKSSFVFKNKEHKLLNLSEKEATKFIVSSDYNTKAKLVYFLSILAKIGSEV